MKHKSPEEQLDRSMSKFTPEIHALATECLKKMRERLPGAVELVYDNYNALVIAFGPTERTSDIVLSIALYPRWVNLFFARGAGLADPQGRLKGEGTRVRHVVLEDATVLDEPGVRRLIAQALAASPMRIDGT